MTIDFITLSDREFQLRQTSWIWRQIQLSNVSRASRTTESPREGFQLRDYEVPIRQPFGSWPISELISCDCSTTKLIDSYIAHRER